MDHFEHNYISANSSIAVPIVLRHLQQTKQNLRPLSLQTTRDSNTQMRLTQMLVHYIGGDSQNYDLACHKVNTIVLFRLKGQVILTYT